MSKPITNYLKVLLFLKQYEDDGLFHNIEDVLQMDKSQKQSIWLELAREELIKLIGGHDAGSITFANGQSFGGGYISAEARITIKGSKYLKEELEMIDNNKYNITIGDNSTANLIMHSPGSSIVNKDKSKSKLDKIIETLQNDLSIDNAARNEAISTYNLLRTEIDAGAPTQHTWTKALSIGANIASIGSLVLALIQEMAK